MTTIRSFLLSFPLHVLEGLSDYGLSAFSESRPICRTAEARQVGNTQTGPALIALHDAAHIGRQLAEANPAAFLPDLAISLSSLSDYCGE